MSTKTVQCLVLFLALLQLGGSQGQEQEDGQNDSGGLLGECVRRHELDQLKQELDFWQNSTLRILNRYLIDEPEGEECSSAELRELHQKLDRVEQADTNHSREVSQTLTTLSQRLTQLDARLDIITTLVSTTMSSQSQNGSFLNPASSCKNVEQGSTSGQYWIQSTKTGYASLQYCNMTRQCCGSRGGWMRVAHLDMTDPNQCCPPGFRLITSPRRMCGRPTTGCVSTTFPVHSVEYKKVCGRITAYQFFSMDAFWPYYLNRRVTIDDMYVEGVSLTHGNSPRKHIWTFANAYDETRSNEYVCPCTRPDLTYTGVVPPFIGQDYFCETGSRYTIQNRFYTHDPLWDGRGCGSRSTCCSFNNPPWFCKELPHPTTDDIELRLCGNEHINNEDAPLELVELYVQ